jgi:cytochrome c oxidase subunit 3
MNPRPLLDNARLAICIFIGTEIMLFAGLISATLVLRAGIPAWPPPGLPVLPGRRTLLHSGVLLASAVTMHLALWAVRQDRQDAFRRALGVTALLGLGFLAGQGLEWARLLGFGLRLSSGVYGGLFYSLIGLHALHVTGAVLWLLEILRRAGRGRYGASAHLGPSLCGMYWTFVVLLWPVLFAAVYLPWKS